MIKKEKLSSFNSILDALIKEKCKVSNIKELNSSHLSFTKKIFDDLTQEMLELVSEEWGLEQDWLVYAKSFVHNPENHIHSSINPFGLTLIEDGDSKYVCGAHLHIEKEIIGGSNIAKAIKEISQSFAFNKFSYVANTLCNNMWHKTMEANMKREKMNLTENWKDNMNSYTDINHSNLSSTITLNNKTEAIAVSDEDVHVKYDAKRLNKYNKPIDNANVGEVMGAFGEALDEVLNRRDIKPMDKEIKQFLNTGTSEMSEGEKSYPGFYIPLAIMALEATLSEKYNISKTINYESWNKLHKPIGFHLYEIGLDDQKKLMDQCYQFCVSKSDPNKKIIIKRARHETMSGHVLELACISSIKNANAYSELFDDIKLWMETNNYYKGKKIDATGKFLNVGKYSWDDIILEPEVKDNVFNDIVGFLNFADLYKKNNLPFKRGLILYGKPGCGKTLLGKVVANEVKSSFIWVTAAQAASASFIKELFTLARQITPAILFFEDIDMYTVDRGHGIFNSMVGEMLAQMDGMEENDGLIVVATTNRLDVIEKALAERPSRFDRRYSLDYLSPATTEKMVKEKLGNAKINGISTKELAEMVFGLNGCFIQEVIVSAKRKAISRNSIDKNGVAILSKEILKESTDEVTKAFNISLDMIKQGELPRYLKEDTVDTTSSAIWNKDSSKVTMSTTDTVTMATALTPKNVNLTDGEKDTLDTDVKDALAAVAKYSEYDDKDEIEDYTSKKIFDDHCIAHTGSVFKSIDWDAQEKGILRTMFRLMVIRKNVVKIAGKGFDPLADKKTRGKILHAMDMLSDRYYWVHAYARICKEFGLKINMPFNPYKNQTSKNGALALYDLLTGKVKTSKEKENEINKKNGVFVPTEQNYDMPEHVHNDPKISNVTKPDLMKE